MTSSFVGPAFDSSRVVITTRMLSEMDRTKVQAYLLAAGFSQWEVDSIEEKMNWPSNVPLMPASDFFNTPDPADVQIGGTIRNH